MGASFGQSRQYARARGLDECDDGLDIVRTSLTISQGTQNVLSTGANALGQFLVYRAIRNDLPQKVKDMDPQVQALCKVLADEVDLLHDAETKDFDSISIGKHCSFAIPTAGSAQRSAARQS